MNNRTDPILYIVIPCYNEHEVLPITAPMFWPVGAAAARSM